MDNQQGQQASHSGHGEETMHSTTSARSKTERIRYLPMPAGPTSFNFPPHFVDILTENRLAQTATVDQQRELMQYVRGLNGWMEHEFGERHDDLRRLRAAFEQMRRDVRDWQDESTTSTSDVGSEAAGIPPQQAPELPATPYPTVQWPPENPNQRQPLPVEPQPQPIVVMIPTMHAPRPIPAVPRRVHAQQLLPPPQQPAIRVSPEPPTFVPPNPAESGVRSPHPSTPAPVPRSGNMGPNVTIISESSSSSPIHNTSGDRSGGGHRRVNQTLPIHPRQSMGSDVIVVPLSSASTRSSTPAMSRLAQRPSATSLTERGILRQTPSGRPQRSQTPLVVTNPPSPVPNGHTIPGPVVSTPRLQPVIRPEAPQPIVIQQSPQPQSVIQRLPSPFPAAMTSTSGPEQNLPGGLLRRAPSPMTDTSFVPVPIASTASSVLMPRPARGPQATPHPHPPPIIRQHTRLRRVQTPTEATQPVYVRTSPTRLSRRHLQPGVTIMPARTESTRRHRPQPARVDPVTVVLPSRPIGRTPQRSQPEAILMPARTESMRNRQYRRQLRPIDTSVVLPAHAVTAMTYPETVSRVRTTNQPPFIFQQPSRASSNVDLRAALQGAERTVIIRRSPSRLSSRHRPQPTTAIPFEAARPSRLTRRHRPQPTTADSVSLGRMPPPPLQQPEITLMPARTESTRNRQNRRRLRPIDTSVAPTRPVTAMTYPETVGRGRTTARPATPFITPLPSPISSNSSRSSLQAAERPAVLRRSRSRSPSHRGQPTAQPSRLTKRRRPEPRAEPEPEIVLMPARTESMRSRQTHRQPRPIEVPPTRAVTTMTYPETVSHARTSAQPPSTAPLTIPRPISSNSSFRSSVQATERPVVIRTSPSRSSFRRAPQPTTAMPIPIGPSSQDSPGPEIVVMPARRRRRDQSRSTDTSPIVLSAPLATVQSSQIRSGVNTGSRSDPSLPHTGVAIPLDSEDEETTAFRPPIERRASFSGRDLISYGSRTGPTTTRSYSSGDDDDDSPPACITPSFRGRSRSSHVPMPVTPNSRQSQSPPRINRPSSTDLWDQKSRTHSQRGWYRPRYSTESSPVSISTNTLLQRPAGRGPNFPVIPGRIIDTVSIRRETRTIERSHGTRRYDNSAGVVVRRMRGDLEGDRTGIMLGPDLGLKRTKSSFSKWLSNL